MRGVALEISVKSRRYPARPGRMHRGDFRAVRAKPLATIDPDHDRLSNRPISYAKAAERNASGASPASQRPTRQALIAHRVSSDAGSALSSTAASAIARAALQQTRARL